MQVKQRLGDAIMERHAAQVSQRFHIQQILKIQSTSVSQVLPEIYSPGRSKVIGSYLGKGWFVFAVFVSPEYERSSWVRIKNNTK